MGTSSEKMKVSENLVQDVLKKMVDDYGLEIFFNASKVNALLMDLVPRAVKERKLLTAVLKENVSKWLIRELNEGHMEKKVIMESCKEQLVSELLITDDAAQYAVDTIVFSIGTTRLLASADKNLETEKQEADGMDTSCLLASPIKTSIEQGENPGEKLKNCSVIGYKALASHMELEELILPEQIEKISQKAFLNCVNLKKIGIPSSIKTIAHNAFDGCFRLEEIRLLESMNYVVSDGLLIDKKEKILIRAENRQDKNSYYVPFGVESIRRKAFEWCNIKRVFIPETIKNIETNAFYLTCELENIFVEKENLYFSSLDGVLHNKNRTVLLKYPQGRKEFHYMLESSVKEVANQAFSYSKALTDITLTYNLKKIGYKAFEYCVHLESITMPRNIEEIKEGAFQNCCKIKCVMLPGNIKEISDFTFQNCTSLEHISIPRMVVRIGHLAFAECKSIKTITIQDHVCFIGNEAFRGCDNVKIIIKNNEYVKRYCQSHKILFQLLP